MVASPLQSGPVPLTKQQQFKIAAVFTIPLVDLFGHLILPLNRSSGGVFGAFVSAQAIEHSVRQQSVDNVIDESTVGASGSWRATWELSSARLRS
jgi:hypothetical protein